MHVPSTIVLHLALRWTARATGLLLVGLALTIMVGEGGPPNVVGEPLPVQIEFMALMSMLTGFLVGWRWEFWGGTLAAVGFVVFTTTELIVNGRLPGGALPYFLIPSVLFLISFRLAHSAASKSQQDAAQIDHSWR